MVWNGGDGGEGGVREKVVCFWGGLELIPRDVVEENTLFWTGIEINRGVS